jgi:hypothetical protein
MGHRLARFDHPAWIAVAGTFAGYALVVLAVFLLLFGLPYLVVSAW